MTDRHLALVVEDDPTTASDHAAILESAGFDPVVFDNKAEALAALRTRSFCVVLLDLEILLEPGTKRPHSEHGRSLLRELRKEQHEHNGFSHLLPVLIVSGNAWEPDEIMALVKDGASDVIPKMSFKSRSLSGAVREALTRSGRTSHEVCAQLSPPRSVSKSDGYLLSIPGDQARRRVRVVVNGRPAGLTEGSLTLLLRMVVARFNGAAVHKVDLGASEERGFKGISILREQLKPAIGDAEDFVDNDHHGNYGLSGNVAIGECNTKALEAIDHPTIPKLARELAAALKRRRKA